MPQTPPKIPYNLHSSSITSLPTPNNQSKSENNNQDSDDMYSKQTPLPITIDIPQYTQKEKTLFDVSTNISSTLSQLDILTGANHMSTLWLEKPENIHQIDMDTNILKDQNLFDSFIANINRELQELESQLKNKEPLSENQISALEQKHMLGTRLSSMMSIFSNKTLVLHRFLRNQMMGHISP